jgi:hypothetical protein
MAGREEHANGIWIKQNLLIVETLPLARVKWASNPVAIVSGTFTCRRRDPHVPNAIRLVPWELERDTAQWRCKIMLTVQQKHHLVGMLGIDREVVGLLFIDPTCS